MKFSAWPSVTNPWSELVEEVLHAEAAGYHSLWIGDHFMAYGPERALRDDTPLPVLHGGARLPREVIEKTGDVLKRWGLLPKRGYL